MNIPNVPRIARFLPSLAHDAYEYIQFCYESYLAQSDDDEEESEESTPMSPHAAGRIALEVTMIGRSTQGKPAEFQSMIGTIVPQIDSPQRAMDVILSLAGMVNVLADDDDLERFGKFILAHEVRHP